MRRAAAAVTLLLLLSCSKHEPVTFRRAQAFVEGDRKQAWTLHLTLVASGHPNDEELRRQIQRLGRQYGDQENLERITADVVTERDGRILATASAAVQDEADPPLREITVTWKS